MTDNADNTILAVADRQNYTSSSWNKQLQGSINIIPCQYGGYESAVFPECTATAGTVSNGMND